MDRFQVKVLLEKCQGILFKWLMTRCLHLDLLENMDAEAFLMALHRFISCRGKPFEILADRGTNFRRPPQQLPEDEASLKAPIG